MVNKIKHIINVIVSNFKSDLFKIIFKEPRYFFFLFKIQVLEKIFGDLYYLSPRHLLIKLFEDKNLQNINYKKLKKFGNYYLDPDKLENNLILYSGGVGTNISFDLALIKEYNCKAKLFDPTPESIEFMKNKVNSLLNFYPYAIYHENKIVKIFFDKYNLVKSNSIQNILNFDKNSFYHAQAYNIPYLMNKFNDNKIDILKLDIEGVSIDVIKNCFKEQIFPSQIILAIEVPRNYLKFIKFYKELKILFLNLKNKYELINLRERSRGVEMEILLIKK